MKPYFWAAGISGDVEVGNLPSEDVDVSFSDILEDLDFALMLGGEARKGDSDVAFLVDLLYIDLEDEGTNVDVTMEQFMGEVDLAFRPGESRWLELLVGMRYWHFDVEVDPTVLPDASKTKDWVDPILGARATFHPFSGRWTAQLRGDGGGFGVGSESTYQFVAGLHYAFNESLSAGLGYRALNLDYDGDDADFDVAYSGPLVGVLWSF